MVVEAGRMMEGGRRPRRGRRHAVRGVVVGVGGRVGGLYGGIVHVHRQRRLRREMNMRALAVRRAVKGVPLPQR